MPGSRAGQSPARRRVAAAAAPPPPWYDAFRRRAWINTYTVLGPELALDDYPFFTPPPHGYLTIFGPNGVRTRTLTGEQMA